MAGPGTPSAQHEGGGTWLQTEARRGGSWVLRGWQAVRRTSRPRGGPLRLHVVVLVVIDDGDGGPSLRWRLVERRRRALTSRHGPVHPARLLRGLLLLLLLRLLLLLLRLLLLLLLRLRLRRLRLRLRLSRDPSASPSLLRLQP